MAPLPKPDPTIRAQLNLVASCEVCTETRRFQLERRPHGYTAGVHLLLALAVLVLAPLPARFF